MDGLLSISALQHLAYCPRQFALIHVERIWAENRFTAEGQILHRRVDSGTPEQRRGVRYERGVLLRSEQLGLSGKADLVEVHSGDPQRYFPVEYKRGKPKIEDWDRIQLCAQALCIEEMRNTQVAEGAIWYWEVRSREAVRIDDPLRETTKLAITQARSILEAGLTPAPTAKENRCKACSLVDICQPQAFRRDRSRRYINEIFNSEEAS